MILTEVSKRKLVSAPQKSTYTLSVNVPPNTGPRTLERPAAKPKKDVYTGRFRRGMSGRMIIMPPVKIPADARPVIARPMMKALEFGAAPHSAEPASRMTREVRYAHFVEYIL
jgi:hypothetical protein